MATAASDAVTLVWATAGSREPIYFRQLPDTAEASKYITHILPLMRAGDTLEIRKDR